MLPSFNNRARNECGSILVFAPFILAIVFLFAAVAIDGVRLYHTRFTLQKLADTAAVGIVGYTVQDGTLRVLARYGVNEIRDVENSDLSLLAGEIVASNAGFLGWTPSEITVTAEQLPPQNAEQVFGVRVNVRRYVRFLLIDRVPDFIFKMGSSGNGRTLEAVAESVRKRANVSLLLDVSRSMRCPSFEPCTCLSTDRQAGVDCPSPQKIDTLRDATKEFVKRFDLDSDRIHFVPFQLLALTYSVRDILVAAHGAGVYSGPIPPSAIGTSIPQAVDAMLDTLIFRHPPDGNSNFSDALHEAYRRMANEVPNPLHSAAYVLVTDGAPTAATLNFAGPGTLQGSPPGSGNRRYVNWTNDFYNSAGRVGAPSALASRDSFDALSGQGMGFRQADPPAVDAARCPTASPVPAEPSEAAKQTAANNAFACVDNLGYYLNKPDGDVVRDPVTNAPIVFGAGNRPNDPPFTRWQEQYFNAAVSEADAMRGMIYVMGIGEPATGNDCYQNADDSQSRHDVFLSRLANDYYFAKQANDYPECDFTGSRSFESWHASANRKQGQYFPISPTEDIRVRMQEIYRQIAIQVQLSLIR